MAALLFRLTGVDLTQCPVCRVGRLRRSTRLTAGLVAVFRPGRLPVPAPDTSWATLGGSQWSAVDRLAAGDGRQPTQRARGQHLREAQALIRRRCRIAAVRVRFAMYLVTRLGLSLADTALQLGVSTSGIPKAVVRAERPRVH